MHTHINVYVYVYAICNMQIANCILHVVYCIYAMISDHRHFFCHRILFHAVLEPVLLVTIVTVYQPLYL